MHNLVRGATVFTVVGLFAASVSGLGGGNAWGSMMDGSMIFIDFEDDDEGDPILAGQMIDDEFAGWGVHITAQNANRPNIKKVIAFDTANITGGETDLVTPGYGPDNDTPLGMVLIVPANLTDGNGDGYVDEPEDHGHKPAGLISFEFDHVLQGGSIVTLDIQILETTTIEFFYRSGAELQEALVESLEPVFTLVVPAMADNGVQTLEWYGFLYDYMRINVGGSGAFDELTVYFADPAPEPTSIALLTLGLGMVLSRRRSAR